MKLTTAICTLAVAGCVATQVSGQVPTHLLKAADSLEAEHCLTTAKFVSSIPAPEGSDWVIPKMMRECAEYHTKACCGKLKEGCLPTFFDGEGAAKTPEHTGVGECSCQRCWGNIRQVVDQQTMRSDSPER